MYYLQSRYYNPTTGIFLNSDIYPATGQGLVGNNMFAYCNNSPVAHTDSQGTRCVPAGRCTSGGRTYYDTPDDAAEAFAEEVYSSSMYIRHEYGAEIYSRKIGGETKYTYAIPRIGTPHSVIVGQSTPPGTEYVAFAHTHPNSEEFSNGDYDLAKRHNVDAYVVCPSKKLWKYDVSTDLPIDLGTISPHPLSKVNQQMLSSKYKLSWEYHLIIGCDPYFKCHEKTWPLYGGKR